MNIVKTLNELTQSRAKAYEEEANKVLASVTDHFKEKDAETLKLLKHFGTSKRVEKSTASKIQAQDLLKGAYVLQTDVRKLCINYSLKLLPASRYTEAIPFQALEDLSRFKSSPRFKNNIFDPKCLFMIAPQEHFSREIKIVKIPKDPALLYMIEAPIELQSAPGHAYIIVKAAKYLVVSSWGEDFGPIRRFYGFMDQYWGWCIFLGLLIGGLGLISFGTLGWHYKIIHWMIGGPCIISAIFGMAWQITLFGDYDVYEETQYVTTNE